MNQTTDGKKRLYIFLHFYTAHLSFELGVDVCEDESRDLNKRDDEGAFGQSTQMVADGACYRCEDGSRR